MIAHLDHATGELTGEGVVETVVGRGYRFLPEVKRLDLESWQGDASKAEENARLIVGRDADSDQNAPPDALTPPPAINGP